MHLVVTVVFTSVESWSPLAPPSGYKGSILKPYLFQHTLQVHFDPRKCEKSVFNSVSTDFEKTTIVIHTLTLISILFSCTVSKIQSFSLNLSGFDVPWAAPGMHF